jgi:YegS/Rv2252/BmrU family lipid kinase
VVIVNPSSQGGALGRKWTDVQRTLRRELGSFEAVMTRAPGEAPRLCREALRSGAGVVAAIGGDGTIHEVANGFFEDGRPVRPEAALGVVPYGTGGDFRKTARIPRELDAAARVLGRGAARAIDVGLIEFARGGVRGARTTRVFVNIASFGISGLVDKIVNASSKALGGTISFIVGTARAALRYRNQRVRLVYDGDEDDHQELTINNVAVANGRYFGGGMKIAPRARLDDGWFDVVALGDLTTMDFLKNGHRVYAGTHLELPKVSYRRARRVEARPVDPSEDVLLDVDGEAPGALPATFSILPGALKLVMPESPA